MFNVPEKYRVNVTPHINRTELGNNGSFQIKSVKLKYPLIVVASDGMGWEHVSVSSAVRAPTWQEMCFIKNLFWSEDDLVIQYHPPKNDYIDCHPNCLHLWRKFGTNDFTETPPLILV